ncbi:hypothetical protein ABK040_005091 [Willaertia magna]
MLNSNNHTGQYDNYSGGGYYMNNTPVTHMYTYSIPLNQKQPCPFSDCPISNPHDDHFRYYYHECTLGQQCSFFQQYDCNNLNMVAHCNIYNHALPGPVQDYNFFDGYSSNNNGGDDMNTSSVSSSTSTYSPNLNKKKTTKVSSDNMSDGSGTQNDNTSSLVDSICDLGDKCNKPNCKDKHPCKYGTKCRMAERGEQNHLQKFFHICSLKDRCKDESEAHKLNFLHICRHGEGCRHKDKEPHKFKYIHPCKFNTKCNYLKKNSGGWKHFAICQHDGCKDKDNCDVCTNGSSKDSELQYHLDFFSLHKKQEKTQHKQPKIDGLVAVDKSKMKPHAKSWEKSASVPVTITTNNKTDKDYCFIGLEKSGHTTNGNLVCYKKTGRGVFDGFIKSVPKSEITLPQNPKIEQPWFKPKVCVYENSTISNVFDSALNQQLQGVSPAATYIQVMTHCINQGIPVFIVGGAVRDVIYAVLKDKETNVQNIMNKVKDIDIGFGCPTQEFCQVIKQKWPNEPKAPGPRGLVSIGNTNGDLFLEGKAINGLNNDNHSVKSDIPQCFGTDLVHENICRDFTCNALWYDPINKCIIDPTGDGQGIKDVLEKIIRIPVKEKHWSFWAKGNPSKIMRYYKFLQKGYKPADEKTRQFIIKTAKNFEKDGVNMECVNQLKIGVMNRKTDAHAQQKKTEFFNNVRNDLGGNFITTNFPGC